MIVLDSSSRLAYFFRETGSELVADALLMALGDRLCLALGDRLDAQVLSADRAWGSNPTVVQIRA